MQTWAIIPALNEEASIGRVLSAIPAAVSGVIVVDNGSTDDTAKVASEHGATVVREPRRGYGSACLAGIQALPDDVDVVAFLDADYSDHPEDLTRVIAPILSKKSELCIGSRALGDHERGALLPQQRFGNWLATRLIRVLFGHQYTDLGPMRAIDRAALDRLSMADRTYGWTVEMQVKALLANLAVTEVPVAYRKRIGKSKIAGTISGSIKAGWKIIATIGALRIRGRRSLANERPSRTPGAWPASR